MPTGSDTKKKIAEEVVRLRVSQMIVNEEYKAGKFKIPVHLALGHEAIAVAMSEMMERGDSLLPTHRNIAYNLARAGSLRPILDEYFLKPTGLNGARSGSMNLLNPEKGIPYASSILGNQFSVATGIAMANKIAGRNNIVIVMGGDGSMEEGSFYESMLMARSIGLPVLFVVENNEWSMATRIDERRSPIDLSLFAESLDIHYAHLGDNDVYHYIDTLKDLRKFAVENSAPICIEVRVSTLGDWRMKTQEVPEGEFINYHAGPAPEVSLSTQPIIRENDEDPVFALTHHIERSVIEEDAHRQFAELQKEIA